LAELVCSNSLGSNVSESPGGLLKEELRRMKSLVMEAADENAVPAGRALAVDRERFARFISERLAAHPLVTILREEVVTCPEEPAVIATGPLTSPALAACLRKSAGGFLAFYDAVAPVVTAESVDLGVVYRASRWGQGEDYLNCPLDREAYERFLSALLAAERAPRKDFEQDPRYFEGCLPVEVLAERGPDTLRYGPLRPVGLPDPRTGREPYAVVQLRQDNREGTLYNLVGFQTNLRWGEQERVFRLIPGLEKAEFVRLGVMHRNIYVNAPQVLDSSLRLRGREALFFAGQLVGVEGYVESTAMGLVAAVNCAALLAGLPFPHWPEETAVGALLHYLGSALPGNFQPMNCNLGIFPPLPKRLRGRAERCGAVVTRAREALTRFLEAQSTLFP
jgi:methylenetetrahydrofolate--tRNA-(uracil-5-)-methyltransferase